MSKSKRRRKIAGSKTKPQRRATTGHTLGKMQQYHGKYVAPLFARQQLSEAGFAALVRLLDEKGLVSKADVLAETVATANANNLTEVAQHITRSAEPEVTPERPT